MTQDSIGHYHRLSQGVQEGRGDPNPGPGGEAERDGGRGECGRGPEGPRRH